MNEILRTITEENLSIAEKFFGMNFTSKDLDFNVIKASGMKDSSAISSWKVQSMSKSSLRIQIEFGNPVEISAS